MREQNYVINKLACYPSSDDRVSFAFALNRNNQKRPHDSSTDDEMIAQASCENRWSNEEKKNDK